MTDRVRIPRNLQNDDFRFIKIAPGEKIPLEKSWQEKNNYAWDDPDLQEHLDNGGNYGVVCGYGGLVVIDADKPEVEKAVRENLPETFRVRTGGGGHHSYYVCKDLDKPIRLKEEKMGDLGDVQYTGKQVVGANSIHPNGRKYEVEKNLPIREISAEELRFALKDFLKDESTGVIREEREALEKHGISDEIPITDVVPLGGLKRRGEEFQGPHPIHGSTGGHNFTVNPRENVWHCFRHGTGGGSPHWIAVQEGIIECSDAVKGALDEHKFTRVLERAVDSRRNGDGVEKTGERPKGRKFNVILADPPWKYDLQLSEGRKIENKYPTMELSEIRNLPVPSAADSVLFLWIPMPKLREGLGVMESWGFEFKTSMVWVKDRIGMGHYARNRHELIFIGIQGDMPPPDPSNRPDSVIEAPRTEHSKKPDEIYDVVEKMYPRGKYLELFARNVREGWRAWGDEIEA